MVGATVQNLQTYIPLAL